MNRKLKILSFLLCFALIISIIPVTVANAASKPSLIWKEVTISIGKQDYSNIEMQNTNSKAKYTYASSDKKIVTVDKNGILTGVKAGTAKITVKQTLNKKTTTVGTLKVIVTKSKTSSDVKTIALGKDIYKNGEYGRYSLGYIEYEIPNATYTYYSNDNSRLVIKKDGTIVEAKKAGKVTVTVKETYKKKTRTVGKLTVDIKKPGLSVKSLDITIGEGFYPSYYIENYNSVYLVSTSDNDEDDTNNVLKFVSNEYDEWTGEVEGVLEGSETVTLYMGTEKKEENLIGSFTVNVTRLPATDIILSADEYDLYDEYETLYLTVEPDNCYETPIITSSDDSIVSVDTKSLTNDYKPNNWKLYIYFKKAGKATLSIKVGSLTKEFEVTVYD